MTNKEVSMKTKALSLLVSPIIALSIFASAAFGQSCSSDEGMLLGPGQGISLSQITFAFDDESNTEPSASGQADVNVPQLTTATLLSSGFINIVTAAGWVGQNLPILPGYPYSDISTRFNLTVDPGTVVPSLNAAICYSPDPFSTAPTDPPNQIFPVGSTTYNAQGKCPGNTEGAACGIKTDPPPPAIEIKFLGGLFSFFYQPNHPNLQAADNQCAPAAFANNFTWLKTTYGTAIPDPNVVGLRNIQNKNALVGKLDMTFWSGPDYPPADPKDPCGKVAGRYADMTQGLFGRLDGCAVTSYWETIGSMTYLISNNLTLKYYHQGTSGRFDGTQNIVLGSLSSIGKGQYVDPQFIFNEIKDGAAIEGGFQYDEGGHEVSIVGAGSILGAPFILYVSDHEQTPVDLTDTQGAGDVDFSYLCQPGRGEDQACVPDPTQASPYAEEEGGTLTDIIMQHP
jgi:hypothetical protein